MSIKITKVFNLNENYKYPICTCGEELSPFSVIQNEINKLNDEIINTLINCELLKIDKFGKDKHLLFICKHCLKNHLKFGDNE